VTSDARDPTGLAPGQADVSGVRRRGSDRRLTAAWETPQGWRYFSEVNNTSVGLWYFATAFVFLLLGGVLALLIRLQLAVPGWQVLDAETYNQVFTMHGTTMMFLFAVPAVEAVAVVLMPNQLASRDLPFPRLSAYGYWCYLFGGTLTYGSLFFSVAPDGGWFMYPPLTSEPFSPGINTDFWLLGLGFVEVSAIAASIELIVGFFKFRAPGMTLDKVPIFSWYMLVVAFMILFAFPPLIVGDILLELERALDWPFFLTERGGDPLLWQHLFWLFGHPEVYIVFLPAAGILSTIIPTMVGRPLFGYGFIVLAAVATGFLSFGLWVHHMYATGLPQLSLAFFSAASLAVAIPSGIQVFCWIATIWNGTPRFHTPMLWALGGIVIFVLGGLTGVMVAIAPFDWQVHDTYFIVAHLHYVLIGGAVFPIMAGIYYWFPFVRGKMLSERLGKWAFWLAFGGFNVAFFPMHIMGLQGMPRRIYDYPTEFGWDTLNLISSFGAAALAAGFALVAVDLVRGWFRGMDAGRNPWNAGTMEWATGLPSPNYAFYTVPWVRSHYPLWEQPEVVEDMEKGLFFLPGAAATRRETLRTGTADAQPLQVVWLPGPTYVPLLAAAATAAVFFSSIFKAYWLAGGLALVAAGLILAWLWNTEWRPHPNVIEAGHGYRLPVYATGTDTHSYWGVLIFLFGSGAAFASLVFAVFYLWTVNPEWPPAGTEAVGPGPPLAAGILVLLSAAAMRLADRTNARDRRGWTGAALVAAVVLMVAAGIVEFAGLSAEGPDPTAHSFGAITWATMLWAAAYGGVAVLMGLFCLARLLAGRLSAFYALSMINAHLFWQYAAAQALLALVVVHLFAAGAGG
jgi:cytochrome c oxidase subunit I+III